AGGDFDSNFKRHGLVQIDAVAVEQRLRFVAAGLDARKLLARQRFRLPPDRLHGLPKQFQAVARHQRAEAALADAAGGDLRAQIAEARFGEAHVVGDDLKEILIGLAAAVDFERAKLQTLLVNFPRAAEAETDPRAADVDPV